MDLDGHIADEVVADALKNIMANRADVKFLGSYPAAGHGHDEVRSEANESWRRAKDWLEGIMPRLINTLATTRSITRKGTNTNLLKGKK